MDKKDMEIAQKLKLLLQEKVKLHQVILFGSRARGDADPESDMDVLVILDEPRTPQVRDAVSDCSWQAGFAAGVLVASVCITRDEWDNGPEAHSAFAEAVRSEGIAL
jgi:DNA polymerase sigma